MEELEIILEEETSNEQEINLASETFDKYVSNVRLTGKVLYLDFNDGTTLNIDLTSLVLTDEQIRAINNITVTNDGELILEYDDTILNIDFSIEDNNLIVKNNVTGLDFNINENGEMEAIY